MEVAVLFCWWRVLLGVSRGITRLGPGSPLAFRISVSGFRALGFSSSPLELWPPKIGTPNLQKLSLNPTPQIAQGFWPRERGGRLGGEPALRVRRSIWVPGLSVWGAGFSV